MIALFLLQCSIIVSLTVKKGVFYETIMIDCDYIKQGDCLPLMRNLLDGCIDLTVTSPPYDNLRTYTGFSFDFENIAREIFRITKEGGVMVWIVNDSTVNGSETGTSFKQALYFKEIGWNLHDTMIWKKDTSSFPERYRYFQSFEYMFVLSKGKPKCFNPIKDRKNKYAGTKIHGTFRNKNGTTESRSDKWKNIVCNEYGSRLNVWEIPSEKHNTTGHPAVFPERLAKDHILSWSDEGDIVLDPFLGSGTTAVACIHTNRHYIGFEISHEYFEISQNRIKNKKELSNVN